MYQPSYEYSQSSSSSSTASSPPPYDFYPPPTAFLDSHQQQTPHYVQDPQPFQKSRPQKLTRQLQISHPYARLFAKKDEVKRRKIWNHALEKNLFNPFELQVKFYFIFKLVTISIKLFYTDLPLVLLIGVSFTSQV